MVNASSSEPRHCAMESNVFLIVHPLYKFIFSFGLHQLAERRVFLQTVEKQTGCHMQALVTVSFAFCSDAIVCDDSQFRVVVGGQARIKQHYCDRCPFRADMRRLSQHLISANSGRAAWKQTTIFTHVVGSRYPSLTKPRGPTLTPSLLPRSRQRARNLSKAASTAKNACHITVILNL